MIFSYVFLPILHNIMLYIYTVRYRFGIKIPDFLENVSNFFLKIQKHIKTFFLISFLFQKTNKNKKYFVFKHTAKS
jgi:hypothetical protein